VIRTLILSIFVSTGALACGPSPLLNHTDGTAAAAENQVAGKPDPRNGVDVSFGKIGLRGVGMWKQGPQTGAESVLEFHIVNPKTSEAVELQGELQVDLWMPDMGHGSSPVEIEKSTTTPGVYTIKKMYFIMNGAWQVRLHIVQGGQVVDETVANVTL
jgi:hypothetical protein